MGATLSRSDAALGTPGTTKNPAENNYLINAQHPDFSSISIDPPKPFTFDSRLFSQRPLPAWSLSITLAWSKHFCHATLREKSSNMTLTAAQNSESFFIQPKTTLFQLGRPWERWHFTYSSPVAGFMAARILSLTPCFRNCSSFPAVRSNYTCVFSMRRIIDFILVPLLLRSR